jgi:hypothetical protein
MVGTSIVAVMRCSAMVSITRSGSKYGSTYSEPPRRRVGTKNAAPAWLRGVQQRKRSSSGHCHSAIWMVVMVDMLRHVPTTPFGWPVVPPV